MIDIDIIKDPTYCLGLKLDKHYLSGETSVDFFYKDMNHYDSAIKEKAEYLSLEMNDEIERVMKNTEKN